jgi:L-lactate dehydrogenase complex protein LldE
VKVALFATCLGDAFFAEACADAVRLLRRFGAEVEVPPGQTCCGQPAFNTGHRNGAARMARHTAQVFAAADHVVLPSGSCAGMIHAHYPKLLAKAEAPPLQGRVWELCHFLVHVLGVETLGDGLAGCRVAYHHGCHALRELGVEDEPVRLLRGAGAEVVAWEADRECCGFGGLFSAKLPEVSVAMADRKLETLPEVDVVTSSDGGCLMQLSGRARHLRSDVPFRHVASLLWEGVAG